MNQYTYDFEVQTMSTVLINAFSDIIIKRFAVDKKSQDQIKTRVVYAPKQRVLADLLDKDQNLQLPVMSVNIGGINRDDTRVFNKILGTYFTPPNSTASVHDKGVLPVDVTYNISIMTRFQQDMDQILSHLLPYINPYFVVSWRTPSRPDHEIRSKVIWNGSVNIQYPVEQSANQVARVVADLTFTFKGWLFQQSETIENIFVFDTNLISTNLGTIDSLIGTDKQSLSGLDGISITNFTYVASPPAPKFIQPWYISLSSVPFELQVWGSGFESVNNVYLSGLPVSAFSSTQNPFVSSVTLSDAFPSFFGVKLLSSDWVVASDKSTLTLTLKPLSSFAKTGFVDVIVEGIKGYGSLIENVPINTFNPYPITSPYYTTWTYEQLPFLSGLVVY
jgi:hypothetical protein